MRPDCAIDGALSVIKAALDLTEATMLRIGEAIEGPADRLRHARADLLSVLAEAGGDAFASAIEACDNLARRQVCRAVAALQIGDATRQRLEHASAALLLLDGRTDGAVSWVCHLVIAQMIDTAHAFDAQMCRLADELAGLTAPEPILALAAEVRTATDAAHRLDAATHRFADAWAPIVAEVDQVVASLRQPQQISKLLQQATENLEQCCQPANPTALPDADELLVKIADLYTVADECLVHERVLGLWGRSDAVQMPPATLDPLEALF